MRFNFPAEFFPHPSVRERVFEFYMHVETPERVAILSSVLITHVCLVWLQQRRPPEEQLLAVHTVVADSTMSSDAAANFEWRVAPTLASGDLTVMITDVTPNAMVSLQHFFV
jgi:hypothetical protein